MLGKAEQMEAQRLVDELFMEATSPEQIAGYKDRLMKVADAHVKTGISFNNAIGSAEIFTDAASKNELEQYVEIIVRIECKQQGKCWWFRTKRRVQLASQLLNNEEPKVDGDIDGEEATREELEQRIEKIWGKKKTEDNFGSEETIKEEVLFRKFLNLQFLTDAQLEEIHGMVYRRFVEKTKAPVGNNDKLKGVIERFIWADIHIYKHEMGLAPLDDETLEAMYECRKTLNYAQYFPTTREEIWNYPWR